MKKFIDKIRLYNKQGNVFRYPNENGRFFVHYIDVEVFGKKGRYPVWDNNEVWEKNNNFIFVPAIVQHYLGQKDKNGNEVYFGNVMVLEINHSGKILEHTIWENAKFFEVEDSLKKILTKI